MFSSQDPSSTNSFSPSNFLYDNEKDNLGFNYHQQIHNPFLSTDLVCHTYSCPGHPPPVTKFVQQHHVSEAHDDLLESVVSSYKTKATLKQDGHSKICTASGLRDRRVRMSVDISRKFFCLQDLLGFDKASKTLDWLLTKSLTSIKDLVEQTNHSSTSTLTHESKTKFLDSIKGDSEDENRKKMKSLLKCVYRKGKKVVTQRIKGGSQDSFSREQLRAEARARARERTKEKFRVKRLVGCGHIEQENGYKDIIWGLMDQEASKQSEDSSFQDIEG